MASDALYNEGRFHIPPNFDFKLLPLRNRKVTVISFIGECDTLFGEFQYMNVLSYSGKDIPIKELPRNYIDGYYDCENQIIFLMLNQLEVEKLFASYDESALGWEESSKKFEFTLLKLLYFIFIVSHFVVITSVSTHLDPRYIRIFKVLDKMRIRMRHFIDMRIRHLPIPREWHNHGRASVPKLLFIFKPPPVISRKLQDWKLVRRLEQNLVNQIFNTFYECALLSNNSVNQLFTLPGHNFVHVHVASDCNRSCGKPVISNTNVNQYYFETILQNLGVISNSTDSKSHAPDNSNECISNLWDFPVPDQIGKHNLSAFLHLHVETMLDQTVNRNGAFGPSSMTFELPSCKTWFMVCYRIYTGLMIEDGHPHLSATDHLPRKDSSDVSAGISLSKSWYSNLSTLFSMVSTSNLPAQDKSNSSKQTIYEEEDDDDAGSNLQETNESAAYLTDIMNHLSIARYRTAFSAAETHYKQDLPNHYSCTYHLIKLISAYNVATSLARGPQMFRLLEKLSHRLTHLYLAGRVTCPVLSLTNQPCQHELHRIPDELASFRYILSKLNDHYSLKNNDLVLNTDEVIPYQPTGVNQIHTDSRSQNEDFLIPRGVRGKWKRYWLESAIKGSLPNQNDTNKAKEVQSSVETDTDIQNHLAVMAHKADSVLISACSCGRQQAERQHPFDSKDANWRFYQPIANICCNKLSSISLAPNILCEPDHPFCLPEEQTSSYVDKNIDTSAGTSEMAKNEDFQSVSMLTKKLSNLNTGIENCSGYDDDEVDDGSVQPKSINGLSQPPVNDILLLSPDSTSHSGSVGSLLSASDANHSMDELASPRCRYSRVRQPHSDRSPVSSISDNSSDHSLSDHEDEVIRKNKPNDHFENRENFESELDDCGADSTKPLPVVFRDGVPTTHWLIGELPRYPSWSIYALGKYFSYSHSSGLPSRGFLRNSNYLLPWDVSIGGKNSNSSSDRSRFNKGVRSKFRDTVKLFIGFEMECPMGHRFFLTGPDSIMDGPMQSSQVKRAVHTLLTSDLPIFLPCRCHSSAAAQATADTLRHNNQSTDWDVGRVSVMTTGHLNEEITWAQLTRIYLAIPVSPIRICVQPCVRLGSSKSNPVFHFGHTNDQCRDNNLSTDSECHGEFASDLDDEVYIFNKMDIMGPQLHNLDNSATGKPYQRPGYVFLENGIFWVIRLPFAYDDGKQPYTRPTTPEEHSQWKLLKGCIKLAL